MPKNAVERYIYQYPQLALPIAEGMSKSKQYKDIVRRGILPEAIGENGFIGAQEDEESLLQTPAGEVQVLYLAHRADFERFVRALSGKCEPVRVPPSMGAATFFNVSNWRRINAHKAQYIASGKTDWSEEFMRFTAEPKNYKDTVVLVSRGYYSALPPERAGRAESEWIDMSRTIRTYHEAAHVVSRALYPEHREDVRDEVTADCVGLIAATGSYDAALARRFLGIEGESYRSGGRLENYVEDETTLERAIARSNAMIDACAQATRDNPGATPFELLLCIENGRIGLEEK